MQPANNQLTFQHISTTIQRNNANKHGLCYRHTQRIAKYRNQHSKELYCVSCAVQEASRGALIEEVGTIAVANATSSSLVMLQNVYQESQEQLQELIRTYNMKYQQLLEALTDLQIRDLIAFNRQIQGNQTIFRQLRQESILPRDRPSIARLFGCQNSQTSLVRLQRLLSDVQKLITSNQQKTIKNPSRPCSPQPRSKNSSSPPPLPAGRSQDLSQQQITFQINHHSFRLPSAPSHEIRHSFAKSQPNSNSFHSKTSTIQQMKKSVLEDTPQSIKQLGRGLRLPQAAAVTMFEKIDVCESVDMGQDMARGSDGTSSLKRRSRYERD